MLTLNGLSGKQLTKAILRDKQLRKEFNELADQTTDNLITQLSTLTTCKLQNGTGIDYIIHPSTYKENHIQCTTFINNEPYSHGTYATITELIKEQSSLVFGAYQVTEAI